MPWIIDKDLFFEGFEEHGSEPDYKSRVGVAGPNGYKGDGSELTAKFRMYTDDDELMFEGRSHELHSFDPLDHFGTPDAGCTWIEYEADGKWIAN